MFRREVIHMQKVPALIHYSDQQLLDKVRWIRRLSRLFGRIGWKIRMERIGKELFWDSPDGKVRLLAHNWDAEGIRPLYINLHGGCFVACNPEMDESHMAWLARNLNIRILNVAYSLAPERRFPQALKDVLFVLDYVRKNANHFGIDKDRIVIGGSSSGANLSAAAQICLSDRGCSWLSGVMLNCPLLDLDTDPYLKPTPRKSIPPRTARLFNAAYCRSDETRNPYVSPFYASKEQLSSFPPTLIITGSEDALCTEGDQFASMLDKAGVNVTHRRFLGGVHCFTHLKHPLATEAWNVICRFLASVCAVP